MDPTRYHRGVAQAMHARSDNIWEDPYLSTETKGGGSWGGDAAKTSPPDDRHPQASPIGGGMGGGFTRGWQLEYPGEFLPMDEEYGQFIFVRGSPDGASDPPTTAEQVPERPGPSRAAPPADGSKKRNRPPAGQSPTRGSGRLPIIASHRRQQQQQQQPQQQRPPDLLRPSTSDEQGPLPLPVQPSQQLTQSHSQSQSQSQSQSHFESQSQQSRKETVGRPAGVEMERSKTVSDTPDLYGRELGGSSSGQRRVNGGREMGSWRSQSQQSQQSRTENNGRVAGDEMESANDAPDLYDRPLRGNNGEQRYACGGRERGSWPSQSQQSHQSRTETIGTVGGDEMERTETANDTPGLYNRELGGSDCGQSRANGGRYRGSWPSQSQQSRTETVGWVAGGGVGRLGAANDTPDLYDRELGASSDGQSRANGGRERGSWPSQSQQSQQPQAETVGRMPGGEMERPGTANDTPDLYDRELGGRSDGQSRASGGRERGSWPSQSQQSQQPRAETVGRMPGGEMERPGTANDTPNLYNRELGGNNGGQSRANGGQERGSWPSQSQKSQQSRTETAGTVGGGEMERLGTANDTPDLYDRQLGGSNDGQMRAYGGREGGSWPSQSQQSQQLRTETVGQVAEGEMERPGTTSNTPGLYNRELGGGKRENNRAMDGREAGLWSPQTSTTCSGIFESVTARALQPTHRQPVQVTPRRSFGGGSPGSPRWAVEARHTDVDGGWEHQEQQHQQQHRGGPLEWLQPNTPAPRTFSFDSRGSSSVGGGSGVLRPTTSRHVPHPSPEAFTDYVVKAPTSSSELRTGAGPRMRGAVADGAEVLRLENDYAPTATTYPPTTRTSFRTTAEDFFDDGFAPTTTTMNTTLAPWGEGAQNSMPHSQAAAASGRARAMEGGCAMWELQESEAGVQVEESVKWEEGEAFFDDNYEHDGAQWEGICGNKAESGNGDDSESPAPKGRAEWCPPGMEGEGAWTPMVYEVELGRRLLRMALTL